VRLDRKLWRRVKVLAAEEDKSAAQWVREAIQIVVAHNERNHHAR
jgi:predicted HicB family RNase H-like nuclease